jgi:hypothetical protein
MATICAEASKYRERMRTTVNGTLYRVVSAGGDPWVDIYVDGAWYWCASESAAKAEVWRRWEEGS